MQDAAPENPEDTVSSIYSTPSTQPQSSVAVMGSESEVEMLPKSVAASPLFRLPRGVRENIWSYCLVGQWPILWPSETNDTGIAVHVLRVCHTIYSEAAPILYSNNTLNFQHPSDANMFHWAHNERLGISNDNGAEQYSMSNNSILSPGKTITKLLLNIRDRDVRLLWTAYLGSSSPTRSLLHDYPNLQTLHVTLQSRYWDLFPGTPEDKFRRWTQDRSLKEVCLNMEGKTEAPDVKVLVVNTLPARDIVSLLRAFPGDILRVRGGGGEVRTRWVRMVKAEVALELAPIEEFQG
jgi:hypothetical protein